MTIQTSSSKKGRFFSCFKDVFMRNKGIGIFYFCLSFVFLPLQFMMAVARMTPLLEEDKLSNFFLGYSMAYTPASIFLFYTLTIGMAFAIPIIMLSYMQNKRAVDVFHSLPYTRNELLGANLLSGILYIMIPMVINFSIIAAVSLKFPDARPMAALSEIFFWLAPVMGTMAITTLACVMVGTAFDSFLFAGGLHITPVVLWLIYYGLSSAFLLGFENDMMQLTNLAKLSPALMRMPYIGFNANGNILPEPILKSEIVTSVVWIFISLLLFALSFYFYNRRKSEQAETATEKGPLSMLLRAAGTASGGLCLAVLFSSTLSISYTETAFLGFTFLGSLIVYLVGDVIISKRIRNLKKAFLPGAVFSLAVVMVTSSFFFDIFGFSTKVPEESEIESVQIGGQSWTYRGRFYNQPDYRLEAEKFTSPEMIEAVLAFHQSQSDYIEKTGTAEARRIYNDYDYQGTSDYTFNFANIRYNLKNGKQIIRRYSRPFFQDTENVFKIEMCDEFIKTTHPIFKAEENMIYSSSAINLFGNKATDLKLSSRETEALIMGLREDLLSPEGKDVLNKKPLGKIIFLVKENDMRKAYGWSDAEIKRRISYYSDGTESLTEITVTVTEGFNTTLSLLKKLGYEDAFANDISSLEGAFLTRPTGSFANVLNTINYNEAQGISYAKEEKQNITLEELESLQDELRGSALFGTPYAQVIFISDNKAMEDIDKKRTSLERVDPITGEHYTVTAEDAAIEIPTTEISNYYNCTGMAFIPYEKLPDSLKRTYLKEFKGTDDNWSLNYSGFSLEFYKSEMERLK